MVAQWYHVSAARYCLGECRYRTVFLKWEPVPMPLLPLPTEHPLKDDGIGLPFALVRGSNHNTSTYLSL